MIKQVMLGWKSLCLSVGWLFFVGGGFFFGGGSYVCGVGGCYFLLCFVCLPAILKFDCGHFLSRTWQFLIVDT